MRAASGNPATFWTAWYSLRLAWAHAGRAEVGSRAAEVAERNEDARVQTAGAFDAWGRLFADALERMRQRGELRADASPAALATALLASIEGGMVLSQARKDPASLRIAVEAGLAQLRRHLS